MSQLQQERCVGCGLAFGKLELDQDSLGRSLGRMDTDSGSFHFRCYWRVTQEAAREAVVALGTVPIKRP